jgi:AraC family transcriptional regulator, ethanolamine operon transcriptional activator
MGPPGFSSIDSWEVIPMDGRNRTARSRSCAAPFRFETPEVLLSASREHAGEVKIAQRRYRNIEEQAASIAGHKQSYAQLTAGDFEGVLESYAISERTAFFVETTNRCIRKRLQVLPGHLRIGFPLGEFACLGNGVTLGRDETSVNLSSTSVDLHFGENYRGCWVTLAEGDVAALTARGEELCTSAKAGRSQVRGLAAASLQNTILAVREALLKPDLPVLQPEAVSAMERDIRSAAAWVLTEAFDQEGDLKRTSVTQRTRLLRRACEIVDARLDSGLTMSELCSIVGTSRRTLESAFAEAFEVSPYEYVRAIRLNAIRRELLSEENAHVSIGDIAARWGIWHTSRFAADYRKMFGQLPSRERVLFWNSQEVVGDSHAPPVFPNACWRR